MKPFRSRNPITVATVGIVVLVLFVIAALDSENLPLIGGGTTYAANVREAAGLKAGDSVRIAGVKVGKVSDVGLDGDHVLVRFKVKDAFVGNQSQAAIKIQTVLGQKYLDVESRGNSSLDPSQPLSEDLAQSVYYDVQQAFNGLSDHVANINTHSLAQSFNVLSDTFSNTPANVRSALSGLSRLSNTISSRDTQISQLLVNTSQISKTLSDRDGQIQQLLGDGSLLLSEIQQRKQSISNLLSSTQVLARQVSGLVDDNQAQLKPVLDELNQLTTLLKNNQSSLSEGIAKMAPFTRVFTNTLGNGHWFDSYVCGLLPPSAGPLNPQGCNPGGNEAGGS